MVGGEEWQEKVYDREEWKRLLRTARNHRILYMPMDWLIDYLYHHIHINVVSFIYDKMNHRTTDRIFHKRKSWKSLWFRMYGKPLCVSQLLKKPLLCNKVSNIKNWQCCLNQRTYFMYIHWPPTEAAQSNLNLSCFVFLLIYTCY